MLKKIKVLLVSGLMMLGMVAPSFADSVCLVSGAGQHKGHEHIISKEDRISQKQIDKMFKELQEKNDKYYHVEHKKEEKAIYVYEDFDMNGKPDEQCGKLKIVEKIKYEPNNEVGDCVNKGWGKIEITPETGDVVALGGTSMAVVAAGALALLNKKSKKNNK